MKIYASTDPRVMTGERVLPAHAPIQRLPGPRQRPGAAPGRPSTSTERDALAEFRWRHSPARAALLRRQGRSGRSDLELARSKAARAKLGPSPFTSRPSTTRKCPQCGGSGTVALMTGLLPCPNCNGTGRVSAKGDRGGKINTEAPGGGGAGASEGGGGVVGVGAY